VKSEVDRSDPAVFKRWEAEKEGSLAVNFACKGEKGAEGEDVPEDGLPAVDAIPSTRVVERVDDLLHLFEEGKSRMCKPNNLRLKEKAGNARKAQTAVRILPSRPSSHIPQ
jgi:hypothetical protein